MKTIKNKPYEAPQLTAVTFKVEEGFALSNISSKFIFQQDVNDYDDVEFTRSGYGDAAEGSHQQSWF